MFYRRQLRPPVSLLTQEKGFYNLCKLLSEAFFLLLCRRISSKFFSGRDRQAYKVCRGRSPVKQLVFLLCTMPSHSAQPRRASIGLAQTRARKRSTLSRFGPMSFKLTKYLLPTGNRSNITANQICNSLHF